MPSVSLSTVLVAGTSGADASVSLSTHAAGAPLYIAGWSNYLWNGKLVHPPIAYPKHTIWTLFKGPLVAANALAYPAALLVTSFVLFLSIASRLILRPR
jgi:phosphate transport system permease protein